MAQRTQAASEGQKEPHSVSLKGVPLQLHLILQGQWLTQTDSLTVSLALDWRVSSVLMEDVVFQDLHLLSSTLSHHKALVRLSIQMQL